MPARGLDDGEGGAARFASAEAWLAARGVERQPVTSAADPPSGAEASRTEVSVREAARLAREAPPVSPPGERAQADPPEQPSADMQQTVNDAGPVGHAREGAPLPNLEEVVAGAVAFARRATASTPMSEKRLRAKLEQRDLPAVAVNVAMERCRRERLVDDAAFVAAFVEERRRKGHAPQRIRADLHRRGLPPALVEQALAPIDLEDIEAQAFDIGRARAAGLRRLNAETAFRRLVGHLARRGYPEALARKVARQVVWVDRERERTMQR